MPSLDIWTLSIQSHRRDRSIGQDAEKEHFVGTRFELEHLTDFNCYNSRGGSAHVAHLAVVSHTFCVDVVTRIASRLQAGPMCKGGGCEALHLEHAPEHMRQQQWQVQHSSLHEQGQGAPGLTLIAYIATPLQLLMLLHTSADDCFCGSHRFAHALPG